MIHIDRAIVSLDIFDKKFCCNLAKCKGACCVQGDSGAPLEEVEAELLKSIFPDLKPFMRREGIEEIEKQGTSVIDSDGDKVTPLVNGKECCYVVFEKGIATCAIEKAYHAGAIGFQKPLSCHLYPVRIKKYRDFDAVNYHQWEICKPALREGNMSDMHLFVFLQKPLIRKYGEAWFEKLTIANEKLNQMKK